MTRLARLAHLLAFLAGLVEAATIVILQAIVYVLLTAMAWTAGGSTDPDVRQAGQVLAVIVIGGLVVYDFAQVALTWREQHRRATDTRGVPQGEAGRWYRHYVRERRRLVAAIRECDYWRTEAIRLRDAVAGIPVDDGPLTLADVIDLETRRS